MLNTNDNSRAELTNEQQFAIVNTKETVERLEKVMADIGQIRAFDFVSKMLTSANLQTLKDIKESKSYKGLTYRNEKGELLTVSSWEVFCKYKLKISRATIDSALLNFNHFSEEFYEASSRIGLGVREMNKLRKSPKEDQELIINSEAVKSGSKEDVKALLEETIVKHKAELAEKQKEIKEKDSTIAVTREMLGDKQQEIDKEKEKRAKLLFAQKDLSEKGAGLIDGIINAGLLITQASNQLNDIYHFTQQHGEFELEEGEFKKVIRMLVCQINDSHHYFSDCTGDAIKGFGFTLEEGYDLRVLIQEHLIPEEMNDYENTIPPEEYVKMNR